MLFPALLACTAAAAYLVLDKDPVFYETKGVFDSAMVRDTWETRIGAVRLTGLRNQAGEVLADALIRRPAELDPAYRIWVVYAGAKTGRRILDLVPERPDVVLVGMQYSYESPEGVIEHLRWPYDIRAAVFRSVAGGMLALDLLERGEQLDLERVVVVGISVGVPFATMLAALDERVPKVMLIHGGGDLAAQVRATQEPRWLALPSSLVARLLFHSFEPLNYVHRITPRELVVIAARDETMLPKSSTEKLYARAGEPKRLIWTESDHVRSRESQTIERIVREIDRYMNETAERNSSPDSAETAVTQ